MTFVLRAFERAVWMGKVNLASRCLIRGKIFKFRTIIWCYCLENLMKVFSIVLLKFLHSNSYTGTSTARNLDGNIFTRLLFDCGENDGFSALLFANDCIGFPESKFFKRIHLLRAFLNVASRSSLILAGTQLTGLAAECTGQVQYGERQLVCSQHIVNCFRTGDSGCWKQAMQTGIADTLVNRPAMATNLIEYPTNTWIAVFGFNLAGPM